MTQAHNAAHGTEHHGALLKGADEEQRAQAARNCFNAGYRDGYACERPNLPAWDSIPEWSNAYSEGYALGKEAAKRTRRDLLKQRGLF